MSVSDLSFIVCVCRFSCCELGASVWLPRGRQHIHPQSRQDSQVLSNVGLLYLVVLIIVTNPEAISVDGSLTQFLIVAGQWCVHIGSLSVFLYLSSSDCGLAHFVYVPFPHKRLLFAFDLSAQLKQSLKNMWDIWYRYVRSWERAKMSWGPWGLFFWKC